MKLISVKILGNDFRNLTAGNIYNFNTSFKDDRLSTKFFTALNGRGKSNMLELLSEIFFFLDYYNLIDKNSHQRKLGNFGFEIEYLLPMNEVDIEMLYNERVKEEWMHIKIKKPFEDSSDVEFSFKPNSYDKSKFKVLDKGVHLLLPNNVIAYTSGQNELLSNPFYKMKFHYFENLIKTGEHSELIDRMILIDDINHFNIFISNFLLGEVKKLEIIKKASKINKLKSFRITINLQYRNNEISFSDEIKEIIEKLKKCTTCWDVQDVYPSKKNKQYILDFLVDENIQKAFKFHFESSFNLFKALYKLEILNLHLYHNKTKNIILNGPSWLNISDEIPKINPDEKIFRVEKIIVDKNINNELKTINYKSLSDGEHQFNEVMGTMMFIENKGTLILMDEPDTHLNPKWRARLIELFNEMSALKYSKNKISKILDREIILTTHSPFAISDSYHDNVYIFERKNNKTQLKNPNIKTYGASIGIILENIFGRDKTISTLSNNEIESIKNKTKTLQELHASKSDLNKFGESIEKFDAISYLFEKEDELRKN